MKDLSKKVVVVMQVKNGERFIRPTLERLSRLFPLILVLDDGSTDGTERIYREFSKVKSRKQNLPFSEARNKNLLLRWAKEEGADWIWMSDVDEIAEDRLDRELRRLVNPENPEILGYIFPFYHFWREDQFRTDGLWGDFKQVRLFKNLPNQEILPFPGSTLASSTPFIASSNLEFSPIRVKHYGNCDPEIRKRKYEYWTKKDVSSVTAAALGNWQNYYKKIYKKDKLDKSDFYRHLIDETGLSLHRWIEDNSVTLTVLARDAANTLPLLMANLGNLVDEVTIAIDDRTKDGTEKIARQYGAKMKLVKFNDNFSEARNESLKMATSKWILRLDMDEMISGSQLFALWNLRNFGEVDVFIFPIRNWLEDPRKQNAKWVLSETCRMFKNTGEFRYSGIVHEEIDKSVRETTKKRKVTVSRANIMIEHTGFLQPKTKEKLEWYNKLNEKQVKLTPDNGKVHFDIGNHYLYNGRIKEAKKHYEMAIKLLPQFYLSYTGLAETYKAEGNFSKSIQYFRQALKYCPKVIDQRRKIRLNILALEERLETQNAEI